MTSKIFAAAVLALVLDIGASAQAQEDYQHQQTIATDGPIIYGTGLSDADRQQAWNHFFLQMVEACGQQQGEDVLGLKLNSRCNARKKYCLTVIDAKLVGIGGIQEPRKVAVFVFTEPHDTRKQLLRMVCTWPMRDVRVCRNWDTGDLLDSGDSRIPEP